MSSVASEPPQEDVRWRETTGVRYAYEQIMAYGEGGRDQGYGPDPAQTRALVMESFLEHCGKGDSILKGIRRQLYIDDNNRLIWCPNITLQAEEGPGRNQLNVIAQFVGSRYKTGIMVLNGDGFRETTATNIQDTMRNRSREIFGVDRTIIIPYEALTAARIDIQTIKPIHITDDTDRRMFHEVPPPPGWEEEIGSGIGGRFPTTFYERLWDFNPQQLQPLPGHPPPGRQTVFPQRENTSGTMQINHAGYLWRITWERASPDRAQVYLTFSVAARDLDGEGRLAWRGVNYQTHPVEEVNPETPIAADQIIEQTTNWCWREDRHQLGASVFRATGFDERRHRWISAFDQHEPQPLYYLAQLPDKGKVETYDEAIHLLAPPIVHQMRAAGRHVERQGDVFAIETNLKTRQVYARSRRRVRRDVVLQRAQTMVIDPADMARRQEEDDPFFLDWQLPLKGEVEEQIPCPCCRRNHQVGYGEEARRTLQIFGTSHTASEVVVCEEGVTFIRGTMFHDPQLEEPDRQAEHVQRELQGKTWYLAVRNTVPRAGTPRQPVEVNQDELSTQPAQEMAVA